MNIAVIPARGGSKRIPRKNIKLFHGKPMIAWSIKLAKDSGLFEHVVVSTDDEEIANIAKEFGAEVPFVRPATLANTPVRVHRMCSEGSSLCWLPSADSGIRRVDRIPSQLSRWGTQRTCRGDQPQAVEGVSERSHRSELQLRVPAADIRDLVGTDYGCNREQGDSGSV